MVEKKTKLVKTIKKSKKKTSNKKKSVKKRVKKKKLSEKNKVLKKLSQSPMLSHSLEGFYRQGKLNQHDLKKLIKLKPDKIKLINYYLNLVKLSKIIPKKNKLKTSKVINQVKKKLLKHSNSKQKKLNKL